MLVEVENYLLGQVAVYAKLLDKSVQRVCLLHWHMHADWRATARL